MSDWRLLRFHRDVPEAHRLVRQLIQRIYRFADELDSGADGNLLVSNFLAHFQTEKPLLFALGIMKDSKLTGHLLVQFENYYGATNMTVIQYEMEEAPPMWFHRQSFEALLTIGRAAGATTLLAICPDEKVERAHKIFHGMKRYATIMTLDLAEAARGRLEEVSNG